MDNQHRFRLPEEGIDLNGLERSMLEQALDRTRGNRTKAARLLGITRNQVRYRLKKLGLDAIDWEARRGAPESNPPAPSYGDDLPSRSVVQLPPPIY